MSDISTDNNVSGSTTFETNELKEHVERDADVCAFPPDVASQTEQGESFVVPTIMEVQEEQQTSGINGKEGVALPTQEAGNGRGKETQALRAAEVLDGDGEEPTEKRAALKDAKGKTAEALAIEAESSVVREDAEVHTGNGSIVSGKTRAQTEEESTQKEPSDDDSGTATISTRDSRAAPVVSGRLDRRHPWPRVIAVALLVITLVSVIAPLSVAAGYSFNAYETYHSVTTHANSGLQHLLNVRTILTGAKSDPTGMLDSRKLTRVGQEFSAAREDFIQVQSLLNHTLFAQAVMLYLPQYRPQIMAARTVARMGEDASEIGQQLVSTAIILAPKFHGPLLADSHTPLVTSADLALVNKTVNNVLPLVDDIQAQGQHLSLNDLPINAHRKDQLQQFLQLLPEMRAALLWGRDLLGAAGWLLGVDQPRTFLVQTMDRAELRPTGGFTGQYGELHVQNGRVAPFSLRDISFVEYSANSPTTGHLAPAAYRSWWPFANWGLRDSNLSADFPTSAQIAIQQYKLETHHSVDGIILFTPFLIEHILDIIGPLHVPRYNETITSQNLEEKLHYYQLDNAGIRRSEIIEHVEDPDMARKLFTSQLARTLMDQIRHAPPEELLAIGLGLLHDLKTKDLQVYMTNPQVEDLLVRYGYAAQIDRSLTHDGLYIVQANVSASKASQYVQTIVKDTVNLDQRGGATHLLQMRLVYNQEGPVYGLDTYRDYVRVYVPPSAKFLWGDGFDTGVPLCGGPLGDCPANGIYPHQELVCPTGQYQAGATAPTLGDPYAGQWHPLDKIGPPTNLKSDEPQRAMFGGYVIVPKNCSMTVTLSWYVPPMGTGPYTLLVQRQSGTFAQLDLTILPSPANCGTLKTAGIHVNEVLSEEDVTFSLPQAHTPNYGGQECYPSSAV